MNGSPMSTLRAGGQGDLTIVISPCSTLEFSPRIVAAAGTGGGLGVLDLANGDRRALEALRRATSWSARPVGVRVPAGCAASMSDVERAGQGRVDVAVLEPGAPWNLADAAARYRTLVEVTSLAEAHEAAAAGAQGLIARGMEAGGRVSELSSFVLMQQLLGDSELNAD